MDILGNPDHPASTTTKHIATRCRLHNGILQYEDFIPRRGESKYVAVAPESIRKDIVTAYHHNPHGHMGAGRAELTIRANWWWPNMMADIRQVRKDCQLCNSTSASGNPRRQGTLSTWQPMSPHHEMAVDIYDVGDFGGTRREYKYALVCVYTFSRYPVIVPLTSKSADEVATALFRIMINHGFVSIIRHDRGKEFDGSVQSMCEHFGIGVIKTARDSPYSNGAVERVNEELKTELRRFRQNNPNDDWEEALPLVHFKLRSAPNRSTSFTPYELMGLQTPTPSGAPIDDLTQAIYDSPDNQITTDQIQQWANQLSQRRTQALTNDIAARDKRLTEMNKHRKPLQFQINDWVRIRSPAASKTALQVTNPQRVMQVSRDKLRYKIQDQSSGRSKWVSISEIISSPAPDAKTTATATSTTSKGIAVVLIMDHDLDKHMIVEHYDGIGEDAPRRRYVNKRPSSSRTQQKWTITQTPSTNYDILEHFNLEKRKEGILTIPKWICNRYPNLPLTKAH